MPEVARHASEGTLGRRLSDHESVSGTTIHGWPSAIFGLVFVGASAPIFLVALGRVTSNLPDGSAPRFIAGAFGVLFVVGGLSFVAHGLAGVRRAARVRRGRKTHPYEPWRWDHAWNEKGAQDDTVRRLLLWVYRVAFIAVFMLPLNWLVFLSGDLPWWGLVGFGFVTGLFDLLVVYVAYRFVESLIRFVWYGVGGIRCARFPFFLGESLDVSFAPTGRMAALRELRATLRCVEERYEVFNPDDSDSSTTVACYELYTDTKMATGAVGRAPSINLSFSLPENAPSTKLGERPPRYWELEIEAETPGVDYEATFIVPVYSRGARAG